MKEPVDQDHYRVLDIAYNATAAQLKKAYHAAAKKHHPDRVTPTRTAKSTVAFQHLQAAYETLSDSTSRKAYNSRYPAIKAQWDEWERHQKTRMAKRQRRTRFTEEIIVLHSENDEFKVHLHFLTARSAFFRGQAEIARRNGIGFTDEDDVVAAYVHFVYHGEILTELSEAVLAATEEADGSTIVKAEHDFLAKLYIFGEKVKDDAFCDQVITTLAASIDRRDAKGGRTFPNCRVVKAIYEGTTPGSPIRQMMVDIYAENSGQHWFPHRAYDYFHPEFSYDLVREILLHKTQCPPKGKIVDLAPRWHKQRDSK
ncbi:hypothetical protein CKM354_000125600 [Cercospora kikuchii]|uniref:J domain-containing protein n=1 Tax=Cercospora kikuchii TaxID=84275 RepID=A0A9P3C7P4_9PEZI|nr:uncharacterized protein CKM354_000125600 [Cercospora kikuchii]GIZ37823.1 hypothetical protein CKM354_000125600 [Cercospora kikuchii]